MYRDESRSSARDNLRRIVYLRRAAVFTAGSLTATLLTASPAAARDFNCFEWVAATASHVMHPHHHHAHAGHVIGVKAVARPHPHRIRPIATHYVRRPVACPVHEVAALASPVPGAPAAALAGETGPQILAGLAGPPPAAGDTDTATEAAAAVPAAPVEAPPEFALPGFPPSNDFPTIIGFPTPGGPGGPPEISPPVVIGPPVDVTPPGSPPLTPPETPPIALVPTPPGGPGTPPLTPPGGPGPGPMGGAPEPASWALMLLGCGILGTALRRRTAAQRA